MKTLLYILGRVYQYAGYHFTRGRIEQAQRLEPLTVRLSIPYPEQEESNVRTFH